MRGVDIGGWVGLAACPVMWFLMVELAGEKKIGEWEGGRRRWNMSRKRSNVEEEEAREELTGVRTEGIKIPKNGSRSRNKSRWKNIMRE